MENSRRLYRLTSKNVNHNLDQLKKENPMLANIASYWFVSLPGVLTGLLLLKLFKQAREKNQSQRRVRATMRKRK